MISRSFLGGLAKVRSVNQNVNLLSNLSRQKKFNCWEICAWFHNSPISYKQDTNVKIKLSQKKAYKESLQTIEVWQNMTLFDLTKIFDTDLEHIKQLIPPQFENCVYGSELEVTNLKMVYDLAKKFGKKCLVIKNPNIISSEKKKTKLDFTRQPPSKPENLVKRPPVVTIMGHVDHGKTTLLDSLRNSFIVNQEFGGITQHIGAFSVELVPGQKIVFIDTPGHAAFSAMRSRGAEITDIVVLVIAADDGVMEQTVESVRIARKSGVRIIVAVNKIDKPNALKIDVIKEKLIEEGIQVEDKGGDIQLVPISALKKINLDLLIEAIFLEAELMNLKGDPTGLVEGVVIESKLDKKGILATVLVKRGTLKNGTILIAGNAHARVRIMLDENGREYKQALPSTPVQILGWRTMPAAGDEVFQVDSEKEAKRILARRKQTEFEKKTESDQKVIEEKIAMHREMRAKENEEVKHLSWKEIRHRYGKIKFKKSEMEKSDDEEAQVTLLLKGDVHGTLEVLLDVLNSYNQHDECKLNIVEASVGHITLKDVELAEVFNAIIYAFNVDLHPSVIELIRTKEIDIRYFNVIYKLVDDLKLQLSKQIPPKDVEKVLGEAEIQQHFVITQGKKKIPVAGCKCTKGELKKDSLYRIMRGEEVIYSGTLTSMKHHKNEVKTINKNVECGLMFDSFSEEFKPGDKVVSYEMIKVPQKTSWDPGF